MNKGRLVAIAGSYLLSGLGVSLRIYVYVAPLPVLTHWSMANGLYIAEPQPVGYMEKVPRTSASSCWSTSAGTFSKSSFTLNFAGSTLPG